MRRFIIKHKKGKAARVVGIYNGVLPEGQDYFVGFSATEIPTRDFLYLKAVFKDTDYIVTYNAKKKKAKLRIAIGEPKMIACQRILKYINGFNSEKNITAAEAQATAATFNTIMIQLLTGGIGTAKLLVEAADLSGTFYVEADRLEILDFIAWEIKKLG